MKRGGIETAIGHWSQLMEGMHAAPQDFYTAVTAAIEKREIPDCRLSRVLWREGSMFSAKREYLRARRGRHLVDVCGAPFGNAFFASTWACLPPPNIVLAVIAVLVLLLFGVASVFDVIESVKVIVSRDSILNLLQYGFVTDRLAKAGISFFLAFLITIFGILRPLIFPPKLTFYRYDTAQMFYRAVHNAVIEVIQGLRQEQGLRLLTDDELKPIMKGLGR